MFSKYKTDEHFFRRTSTSNIYLTKLPFVDDDKGYKKWIKILEIIDSTLLSTVKRGDLLENMLVSNSDFLGPMGVYIFDLNEDGLYLRDFPEQLPYSRDTYVPLDFELITQFKNPRHWIDSTSGGSFGDSRWFKGNAIFHINIVYVPLNKLTNHIDLVSDEDIETYNIKDKNTIKISYDEQIYFIPIAKGLYKSVKKWLDAKKTSVDAHLYFYENECLIDAASIKYVANY